MAASDSRPSGKDNHLMAKEQIVWDSLGVSQLRFEDVDQAFEGYLTQIDSGPGFDDLIRNTYTFLNEGSYYILYGSVTLDRQLQNAEVNGYFRITYKGTEKTERGYNVKIYTVDQAQGVYLSPEDG
jgi:hypothetical protein